MIKLVIAACLASGECMESRLTYDAREVSLMTCMVAGRPMAGSKAQLEQLEVNGWRTLSVKLLDSLALNFRGEEVW